MFAGFWIRLAAHLIDWVVLALADVVLYETSVSVAWQLTGWPPPPGVVLAVILGANLAWHTGFTASPLQATPGKYLLGLRVVGADLQRCGLGRALLRSLAFGLSWATLGLGFVLCAFTRGKLALHDYVANTRVLRRARAEPGPRRGVDRGQRAADRAVAAGVMLAALVLAGLGIGLLFTGDHVNRLGRWAATVAAVIRAGDAPGTAALEAAGCRARVITVAQAMELVAPFTLGEIFDPRVGEVPYLSCRRRHAEAPFDCATVARRWLAALRQRPMVFIVAVYPRRGWAPLCRAYYDAAGRRLGSVGRRGALLLDRPPR